MERFSQVDTRGGQDQVTRRSETMTIQRREVVQRLGGLMAAAAFGKIGLPPNGGASLPDQAARTDGFPRKADFLIPDGSTYLNAAYTHPIPNVSIAAARRAAERRSGVQAPNPANPRAQF